MAEPELEPTKAVITGEHGALLMQWEFPEFTEYKRSKAWYVITSLIAVASFVASMLSRNPLFAIFIVIVAILYFVRERQQPNMVTVSITEDGIGVNKQFYLHSDLKQFWIAYDPPEVKRLYVRFQSGLRPNLSLSIENQDPVALRTILLRYLEEDLDQRGESFSDGFQRLLKL